MQDTLGKIVVATPGVPVRLTSNLANPTENFYVHAYAVQRRETSAGKLYIQKVGTDVRALSGPDYKVLAELTKTSPAFGAGITMGGNTLDLSKIWVDADNAGDSVIVPYLEY